MWYSTCSVSIPEYIICIFHSHTILLLCLPCSWAYFPAWSHAQPLVHTRAHAYTQTHALSCRGSRLCHVSWLGRSVKFFFLFFIFFRLPSPQQKKWQEKHFLSVPIILCRMESVRRFGSCSRSKSFQNRKGRSRECRSVAPEWSLGSRIKAQGEEAHDWTRQTVATLQAGVDPLFSCAKPAYFFVLAYGFYRVRMWLDVELEVRWLFSLNLPLSYSSLMSDPFWGFHYLRFSVARPHRTNCGALSNAHLRRPFFCLPQIVGSFPHCSVFRSAPFALCHLSLGTKNENVCVHF